MDSIIGPIATKVSGLSKRVTWIARGLVNGDPLVKSELRTIWGSVINIKADLKTAYATLTANLQVVAGLKDVKIMLKMIIYYTKELFYAIKLITSLFQLFASIFSITTIIALVVEQIQKLKDSLNTKIIWLKRQLIRLKQKALKEVEWIKRKISAQMLLAYLKISKKSLEATIATVEANQQSMLAVTNKIIPQEGVNGEYVGIKFEYYDPNLAISADQLEIERGFTNNLDGLKNKLAELDLEIEEANNEIDMYIPDDKKLWRERWAKEDEKDYKMLINAFPSIGAGI